ncbi:hypothetical protein OAI86_00015 [Alphaproteobacteria bacterium]|nr:hypothetical protein [Alphaproteobacteria bacterium]
MPYTLNDLADDVKEIIVNNTIPDGSDKICYFVSKALMDQNFIVENLPDRLEGEPPRQILYEDKDTGFCICGHVYANEAIGSPHDHGPSWAIYGQASGETEMTDWEIIRDKSQGDTIYVKPIKKYIMKAGDVHFYDVGHVHSPVRKDPVRLLRIEGDNLDHITRSNIKPINDKESLGSV